MKEDKDFNLYEVFKTNAVNSDGGAYSSTECAAAVIMMLSQIMYQDSENAEARFEEFFHKLCNDFGI